MEYNSFTLHNYKAIPQLSKLTPAQIEAIEVVGRVLPFKTNNYVIDELINWGNIPDDPIFTLTFPRSEMLPATAYNKVKFLLENKADEELSLIHI